MTEEEMRDSLNAIVDEVSADSDAMYRIERDGKPKAVLIGFEAYRHLCTIANFWEGRD